MLAASMHVADLAMAAASKAGYTPVFKGVLWSQGEADAHAIDSNVPGVSQTGYENALKTMIAAYRAHFGSDMSFFIFKTGTQPSASDMGYQAVRDAQEDAGASDPHSFVVFRGAYDFWWRCEMASDLHYTQPAYNEMGTMGAGVISWFRAHPLSPKTPAAFPGSGDYPAAANVMLSSAGSAYLVYTLDGSAPDCANPRQRYKAPLVIANAPPTTLLASGCRGAFASPVAQYSYNYTPQPLTAPSASPLPGSYQIGVMVTLTAPNATSIRHVWASDPTPLTCTSPGSVVYAGPFALSQSHASFRAIACNGPYASAVQSFAYTVTK
jgi:hypothetical protein